MSSCFEEFALWALCFQLPEVAQVPPQCAHTLMITTSGRCRHKAPPDLYLNTLLSSCVTQLDSRCSRTARSATCKLGQDEVPPCSLGTKRAKNLVILTSTGRRLWEATGQYDQQVHTWALLFAFSLNAALVPCCCTLPPSPPRSHHSGGGETEGLLG
jgi:hypothetical protein